PSPWIRPNGSHQSLSSFPRIKDLSLRDALATAAIDAAISPGWLAWTIDRIRPDIVHSTGLVQSGFLTLAARMLCARPFPRWLISSLGVDTQFYSRVPWSRPWILQLLAEADAFFAECARDVDTARDLGFTGIAPCVELIGGGWDTAAVAALRQPGPPSARRAIAIKGYGGELGRGAVAIAAVRMAADALRGFEIGVFAAHPDVTLAARLAAADTGLDLVIWPNLPYREHLARFGRCRAVLGLSESDGAATTALEAILAGAVPLQSSTSCLDEWIEPDESGILLPANDPVPAAEALRRIATDAAFVDQAVALNDHHALPRLDAAAVNPRIVAMYDAVLRA
ncbi:MAG: glycosyltransferase, partial [Thermomicrobiales bacterium]